MLITSLNESYGVVEVANSSTSGVTFRLRACSSLGCGPEVTASTRPPGPPASVALRVVGKDKLEINIHPPEDDGGANVTHYEMRVLFI